MLAAALAVTGCHDPSNRPRTVPDTTAPPATSPAPPGTACDPAGTTGPDGDAEPPATAAGAVGAAPTDLEVHRDLVYVEDPQVDPELHSLDLVVPRPAEGCGPIPLVVFVHGGGFRRGDKGSAIDGPHPVGASGAAVSDKVVWAASHGWAFASVNYRLMGDPRSGPLLSAWPGEAQDVAAALAWLTDHAGDFGLDPGAVAVMGHSAGAFLAAQVGADEDLVTRAGGAASGLVCVIPVDIEGYDLAALAGRSPAGIWPTMFPDPEQWEPASPRLRVAERSPANDWLIVTRGGPGRHAGAQAMADAVVAAGGAAEVLAADPLTHREVNAAIGTRDDRAVTPTLTSFLSECFADSSQPDP